jgi:hypothetical protein
MPERNDILANRRFWASLYATAFGQITEDPPEPEAYCSLLGVTEKKAIEWNRKFTGWHPGIFDESDGYSDDPATVRLNLAGGVRLRIEFHPGDRYWFLKGKTGPEVMLATNGPHWELPGLRVEEVIAIGGAMRRNAWAALLLLMPVVWLTAGDDVVTARRSMESAWTASKLVSRESAAGLAALWVKAVEGGRDHRWRQTPNGWRCDAQWSTRSKGRKDLKSLNELIAAAQ